MTESSLQKSVKYKNKEAEEPRGSSWSEVKHSENSQGPRLADNSSSSNSNEANLLNGGFHCWYVCVCACVSV